MTKFQRLGSLHTDIYFSQSRMLTILRSRPQQILCLVRTHCSGLFTVTSHDGRSEEALSSLFYKGTNSINEGSTLVKYWPPKVSLANTIILGAGFSIWISREKKQTTEGWEETFENGYELKMVMSWIKLPHIHKQCMNCPQYFRMRPHLEKGSLEG